MSPLEELDVALRRAASTAAGIEAGEWRVDSTFELKFVVRRHRRLPALYGVRPDGYN